MREEVLSEPTPVAAFDKTNELVAIIRAEPATGMWKPEKVLVM
jgi:hypothetical protein